MILCSAEPRIICLPTHVINLVINDNSLEILYILNMNNKIKKQNSSIPKRKNVVGHDKKQE